jgi:hypothetical protein
MLLPIRGSTVPGASVVASSDTEAVQRPLLLTKRSLICSYSPSRHAPNHTASNPLVMLLQRLIMYQWRKIAGCYYPDCNLVMRPTSYHTPYSDMTSSIHHSSLSRLLLGGSLLLDTPDKSCHSVVIQQILHQIPRQYEFEGNHNN